MKLALDATYSVGDHLSGVGVYSREILSGLPAAHPEARFLFCYRPHRFLRSFSLRLPPNCRRRLLHEPLAPNADLFHGLNQRLPQLSLRRPISTFHDLFVLTGDYSSPAFRLRFEQQARDAASRSERIIAVSEFTAGQVVDLLGVDRGRVRVIHHGVRLPVAQALVCERQKLVLHVGAIQKRKNVRRLVEAFSVLPPPWRLVLAGSAGYGAADVFHAIDASRQRQRISVLGYVGAGALTRLYQRASILAFPSLDEGFGIPVLEAMAWGVPVLTSERPALREVAGDAALLVDPNDVPAIAAGLKQLADNPELGKELARRGRDRAATFSWEAAISATWSVYRELAG